jgi:hypothetical protein
LCRPHPALDRPLVAAVVMLARKHRQRDLDELGSRVDRLGFVGRPGFFAGKEGPNIPKNRRSGGWHCRATTAPAFSPRWQVFADTLIADR